MSLYQSMKPHILHFFALTNDAIHIHIGFACLVFMLLVSKKKLSSFYVIIPGFILSLVMELLDLRDDYSTPGGMRFGESFHDIVNTNLIPFVLVLLAKFKKNLT